jgi:hypothetical protein
MEVLMLGHERRSKVLAKLTNARCELEEALNLSIPVARYDPALIPEPARNRLSAMIDDLNGVLRQIEGFAVSRASSEAESKKLPVVPRHSWSHLPGA